MFLNLSSTLSFIDGIKVINGVLYVTGRNSSNGHREIYQYYASGQYAGDTWRNPIDTGYGDNPTGGQQYVQNGNTYLISGGGWRLDGMTETPDGNYLIIDSNGGKVVWVLGGIANDDAYMVGATVIANEPNPTGTGVGGEDGIEVDPDNQVYMAAYNNGLWSINGNSIITAASKNGNNIDGLTQVDGQLYQPAAAGQEWDDIAPLSGTLYSPDNYAPYYDTLNGNTYSDNGYSASDLQGNAFSTYGVLACDGSNCPNNNGSETFKNGSGSSFGWEFNNYPSELVHVRSGSSSPYSPQFTYANLYSQLIENQANSYTDRTNQLPNNKINNSTAPNLFTGGLYTYSPCGNMNDNSCQSYLYVNGNQTDDGGNIPASGVLFVNGNVSITGSGGSFGSDHFYASANDKLLIIASGNVDIYPSNYEATSSTQLLDQYIDIGVIANGYINIHSYPVGATPAYIQPMRIYGMLIDYGGTPIGFDVGQFNGVTPAVQIRYDSSYINDFSKYFTQNSTGEEIGL